MRVVALADTHLFTDDFATFPDGDVLIHAGDALRGGTEDVLVEFAAWFTALPHRVKIFVAGNHDMLFEHDRRRACALLGPTVLYLEDESVVVGGVRIHGSPWTPTFHDWAFMRDPGPLLAEKWARIPDDTDVLVTHGPPLGRGDQAGPRPVGCGDLRARVDAVKPLLHVFGHIHAGRGTWDDAGFLSANVTTWECELPPMVFDVDVARRAVTLVAG